MRGPDTSQHQNERHCVLTKVLPGDPGPFALAAQESIQSTERASEIMLCVFLHQRRRYCFYLFNIKEYICVERDVF